MRILVVNKFLHHVGGVETYLSWLAVHLRDNGHTVHFFGMSPPRGEQVMGVLGNDVSVSPFRSYSSTPLHTVQSAAASVYSPKVGRLFSECIDDFRPDVVHFNMTCRQLTPSLARVVSRRGIPSVTTAHEYKFVCANQRLWDDGRNEECTDCLNSSLVSRMGSILSRKCIKGSVGSSILGAVELPISDYLWSRSRSVVHAPSRYMASLLENSPAVGAPVRYLDLAWGSSRRELAERQGDVVPRVLYIGRLSHEKGVDVLLNSWSAVTLVHPSASLDIYGSGKAHDSLVDLAARLRLDNVTFHGRYEVDSLDQILSGASLTVHPSRWAENSPYTVRESLQYGVPAVVSDRGGLPEMVEDGTGYVYGNDSPELLAAAVLRGLEEKSARTDKFWSVLDSRAVSDDQHYNGLLELYSLATLHAQQAA